MERETHADWLNEAYDQLHHPEQRRLLKERSDQFQVPIKESIVSMRYLREWMDRTSDDRSLLALAGCKPSS